MRAAQVGKILTVNRSSRTSWRKEKEFTMRRVSRVHMSADDVGAGELSKNRVLALFDAPGQRTRTARQNLERWGPVRPLARPWGYDLSTRRPVDGPCQMRGGTGQATVLLPALPGLEGLGLATSRMTAARLRPAVPVGASSRTFAGRAAEAHLRPRASERTAAVARRGR